MLRAEGILPVTAVRGSARGLDVRGAPRLRPDGAEERRGVEGAGTHLHVVRLQDHAAQLGPVALQGKNEILKGARRGADLHALQVLSGGVVNSIQV